MSHLDIRPSRRRGNAVFIRNLEDEGYLESFLVSAVVTTLSVRGYLYLAGFPQVGGKGLHIAHMLWGGLLMVIGIAMLINYLDRAAHRLGTVFAGAGFGLFIDELGKYLTSDNNYFFRPAASLIYIIFVALYLAFHLLQRERNITAREYVLNALETYREAVTIGYDRALLARARHYLSLGADDALHDHVSQLLDSCPEELPRRVSRLQRIGQRIRALYWRLGSSPVFPHAVNAFFLVEAIATLIMAAAVTAVVSGFEVPADIGTQHAGHVLIREADLFFAGLASAIVLSGSFVMFRSRRLAYRLFRVAMLLSIFLTQVFEFYDIQFWALPGLAFNLVGLTLADTILAQEEGRWRPEADAIGAESDVLT